MNVFVSYTLRDGVLSVPVLAQLGETLSSAASPYIDVLHNSDRDPQQRVYRELARAELLLLCRTPAALSSPWVRLELAVAAERRIPVLELCLGSRPVQLPNSCLQLTWRSLALAPRS
jgi:hypothetical protein